MPRGGNTGRALLWSTASPDRVMKLNRSAFKGRERIWFAWAFPCKEMWFERSPGRDGCQDVGSRTQ